MALGYLLDEHLRGVLWRAIQRHNARGVDVLDVVRVGDPADLPLGSAAPALLLWAEQQGRLLISRDERTLPAHLATRLQAGHHSPGIFILRRRCSLPQVVAFLAQAAHHSDPAEWHDAIERIPGGQTSGCARLAVQTAQTGWEPTTVS